MYAMDQTMHLEHRTEQRRPRWEPRRLGARTTSSDPTRQPQVVTADTVTADAESSPVHEFLD